MRGNKSNPIVNPYYKPKHAGDSFTNSSLSSASVNPYYQMTGKKTSNPDRTTSPNSISNVAINPYFSGNVIGKGNHTSNDETSSTKHCRGNNHLNSRVSIEAFNKSRDVISPECDEESVYSPVEPPQPTRNNTYTIPKHCDIIPDKSKVSTVNGTTAKDDMIKTIKNDAAAGRIGESKKIASDDIIDRCKLRQDLRSSPEKVCSPVSQAPDTFSTFLKLRAELLRPSCDVVKRKIERQQFDESYMKEELQRSLEQLQASHAEVQALKAQASVMSNELLNRQNRINDIEKCNQKLTEERDELEKIVNSLRSGVPTGDVALQTSSQRHSDTLDNTSSGSAKSGIRPAYLVSNKLSAGNKSRSQLWR
eukprot:Tbor_TRINITY_DN4773_c0_g1::TRINITY_DN4773_c0_g1_i1::g.17038::m.17038